MILFAEPSPTFINSAPSVPKHICHFNNYTDFFTSRLAKTLLRNSECYNAVTHLVLFHIPSCKTGVSDHIVTEKRNYLANGFPYHFCEEV